MQGKCVQGGGNSKCNGPKIGNSPGMFGNSKETSVALPKGLRKRVADKWMRAVL